MTLLFFADSSKKTKTRAPRKSSRPQQQPVHHPVQQTVQPAPQPFHPNMSSITLTTQLHSPHGLIPPQPTGGWHMTGAPVTSPVYSHPYGNPNIMLYPSTTTISTQFLPSYHTSPPSSPYMHQRTHNGPPPSSSALALPIRSQSYPPPDMAPPRVKPPKQTKQPDSSVISSCDALTKKAKKLASASMVNLNNSPWSNAPGVGKTTECLVQGAALCDVISSKLDAVLTRIDGEDFSGEESDLVIYDEVTAPAPATMSRAIDYKTTKNLVGKAASSSNYFTKAWLYSNSRLPPYQKPLRLYLPTWPLLCLAAQYSERVYTRPQPSTAETEVRVEANWRRGTKAMVLKSIAMDEAHAIVFAVRGSQTFMDWAVNFRPAPSSPAGFLDDEFNLCHAGFLHVARSMIAPVAARLRTLLQEDPSRTSTCSLIITGHSAGGAVAALLFAHMMSTVVQSELTHLTGFFKRVHCVTFGAPPVSLLPLTKSTDRAHRKSIFFSFVNEGDPVARADRETVLSLLRLYSHPAPPKDQTRPWNMPTSTLSVAGTVIVLRTRPPPPEQLQKKRKDGPGKGPIEACVVSDEHLRKVVYGDPVMHMMKVYCQRIEELATRAVTAQGFS